MENNKKAKDWWDKLEITLIPVGGFLTAIAVALVGYFGTSYLERRQAIESSIRLYSELMSRREEADSILRKDILTSVLESFLKPNSATFQEMEDKLLNLEVLIYNFHESLDLRPVFAHIKKQISDSEDSIAQEYVKRLEGITMEIASNQIAALLSVGKKLSGDFDVVDNDVKKGEPGEYESIDPIIDESLKLNVKDSENLERRFRVFPLGIDLKAKEVKILLQIITLNEERIDKVFFVRTFDLPMINNIRLSNGERCAIVVNAIGELSATITLVYFPGSHAGLKDKPYIEEVMKNLLKATR